MQPVPVKARLVARQNTHRLAAASRLGAHFRQPLRQGNQVASVNRVTAQPHRAWQHHTELPLRLAQFKNHLHRGILVRGGGCVSTIELRHLDPPGLEGWWKTSLTPPDLPSPP